jgi:hypothetical protein
VGRDRDRRRGAAGEAGVLIVIAATLTPAYGPERDVDGRARERAAGAGDVAAVDVRQRLEGGHDRRGGRVVRDRGRRLALERQGERAAGRRAGDRDPLDLVHARVRRDDERARPGLLAEVDERDPAELSICSPNAFVVERSCPDSAAIRLNHAFASVFMRSASGGRP